MLNDLVLVESRVARNAQCDRFTQDTAYARLQAHGLLMALWGNKRIATTKQMAEFYQVPVETVQTAIRDNRDELYSDGLKVTEGEERRDVMLVFNISSKAPKLTIWTPRAALRLGMALRDSEVAKAVRTTLLDLAEAANPAKPAPAPAPQPQPQPVPTVGNLKNSLDGDRRIRLMPSTIEVMEALHLPPSYIQGWALQTLQREGMIDPDLLPSARDRAPMATADVLLTPTEVADKLRWLNNSGSPNPRRVNAVLERLGYQERFGTKWQPTVKAKGLCERRPVMLKDKKTEVDQLFWKPPIISIIQENVIH